LIVVDSSAVVAVLLTEPDAGELRRVLDAEIDKHISVATVLECCLVLHGKVGAGPKKAEVWMDRFLADGQLVLEPVTEDQLTIARKAYLTYGKGMGHPAQLNFGDCFSYALAKSLDVPLLYKGNDFAKTDIKSAL
jgi:ribonuclease VapC